MSRVLFKPYIGACSDGNYKVKCYYDEGRVNISYKFLEKEYIIYHTSAYLSNVGKIHEIYEYLMSCEKYASPYHNYISRAEYLANSIVNYMK